MKKPITMIALICAFALLTGCGAGTAAPSAVEGPLVASATAAPPVTPEPPSTEPDLTAEPEATAEPDVSAFTGLLEGVYDNFHFGTAGSSLTAAWYAAAIVDWGVQNGTEAVRLGCAAFDREMVNEFNEDFADKLDYLYTAALGFYGAGVGVLDDSGWPGEWTYAGGDVHEVFGMIYPALGLETPAALRVYYPDSEVMYLRAEGVILENEDMADNASALNAALSGRVFSEGAQILSAEFEAGVLALDLNAAFADQVRALGTSGELLTISSVVNTAIDFTGANAAAITVEGETLETGHNIYSEPIGYFDNTF